MLSVIVVRTSYNLAPVSTGRTITEHAAKYLNSKMTYCSFGNNSDPCGAVKWALRDDAIISLMSCTSDMGPYLKNKYKGSGASGMRGRPKAVHTNTTSE